jgi:DNA replication protein DnaC
MQNINEIYLKSGISDKGIKRYRCNYSLEECIEICKEIGQKILGEDRKFSIDGENYYSYKNTIQWVFGDKDSEFDLKKGLFFHGVTGTGKTMMIEIINTVIQVVTDGYGIRFISDGKPCTLNLKTTPLPLLTQNAIFNKDFELYQNAMKYRSIFLDEIGSVAEIKQLNIFGNIVQAFPSIIASREYFSGLMICTSNLTREQILKEYGDMTESRLTKMCTFIECTGTDRRK